MPVEVEGLPKLARQLLELGLELDDLKDAFASISREGAELAAGFAPKRTGRLAGTIRGNRAKNKAVVTAGRGKRVAYAGPINYGWPKRNITAAGFMQKADDQLSPFAVSRLETAVNQAIARKAS